MDWTTAWRALLPVYGLAVVLHAFFPAFSVPVWAIYGYYGFKVLEGARTAERPWRGRGSPRPYLVSALLILVVHYLSLVSFVASESRPALALLAVSLVMGMGLVALFTAASAPPGIRDARGWIRAGFLAEVAASVVNPVVLGAFVYLGNAGGLGMQGLAIVLSASSYGAFVMASRAASRRAPAVARKVLRE